MPSFRDKFVRRRPPVRKIARLAFSEMELVAEAVRLVIWDLDETFWKGTLTEGGIQEYVRAHHDIVIELARRGIISSICSKNDEAAILPILRDHGILDYFVFPSISWEPKGHRLASLIETAQLRPATVMFIDDNPNNRAEAGGRRTRPAGRERDVHQPDARRPPLQGQGRQRPHPARAIQAARNPQARRGRGRRRQRRVPTRLQYPGLHRVRRTRPHRPRGRAGEPHQPAELHQMPATR